MRTKVYINVRSIGHMMYFTVAQWIPVRLARTHAKSSGPEIVFFWD